jgi:hypothetical protein
MMKEEGEQALTADELILLRVVTSGIWQRVVQ